ncbi:MAG: LapA family protein [Anaerolineae bacterium]
MLPSLIILVVASILAAYFATNNLTIINVNLLGYPIRGTTGTLMVTALGIGVALGVVLMLPAYISRSWALIRHRRKLQDLQDRQGKPPYSVDEETEED